jgi:hypothetical protein
MIRLNASLSRKLPVAGVEFSSQSLSAGLEVEVSDSADGEEISRHFPAERTPSSLKFGGAIHRAVEAFYRARMAGHLAGMDEVLASLSR